MDLRILASYKRYMRYQLYPLVLRVLILYDTIVDG